MGANEKTGRGVGTESEKEETEVEERDSIYRIKSSNKRELEGLTPLGRGPPVAGSEPDKGDKPAPVQTTGGPHDGASAT